MSTHALARVEALDALIASFTKQRDRALREIQAACLHPRDAMIHGDYRPAGIVTYAKPDFLVCKDCGLAEEGWGFFAAFQHHYNDHHSLPCMDRDEAWKYIRTFRDREAVSKAQDEISQTERTT